MKLGRITMLFLALGCVGQVSARAPSSRPFLICRWSLEESVNAQENRSARRSEAECSEHSFLRGQTTSVVDQKSTSSSDYFALAAFSERGCDVSNCDVPSCDAPSCGCGVAASGCSDCSWLDRLLSGDSWLTLDAARQTLAEPVPHIPRASKNHHYDRFNAVWKAVIRAGIGPGGLSA